MTRRTIHPDPRARRRAAAPARLLAVLFAAALPLLVFASCSDSGDEPAAGQPDACEYAALEDSVLVKVNAHRASLSLPALQSNAVIVDQARKHSIYQASVDSATHDGSAERAAAIGAKITVIAIGENVAMYSSWFGNPAGMVVSAWLGSPPHKAAIEGDFNLTGVGVARNARGAYFFTQIFVKSR